MKAALSDTQDLAEALIAAEAKLGEMIIDKDKIENQKATSGSGRCFHSTS